MGHLLCLFLIFNKRVKFFKTTFLFSLKSLLERSSVDFI